MYLLSECFFTQGSLKEKTVENLEKYVVKDVSKVYLRATLASISVAVVTLLLLSLIFLFSSPPTSQSFLSSSVAWKKSPKSFWLRTAIINIQRLETQNRLFYCVCWLTGTFPPAQTLRLMTNGFLIFNHLCSFTENYDLPLWLCSWPKGKGTPSCNV